jgi:hypothetical protein
LTLKFCQEKFNIADKKLVVLVVFQKRFHLNHRRSHKKFLKENEKILIKNVLPWRSKATQSLGSLRSIENQSQTKANVFIHKLVY